MPDVVSTAAASPVSPGPLLDGFPPSPPARRWRRTRWRDPRLAVGVLLVAGSALIGGHLLATAEAGTALLVATRPLAAGQVLAAQDLTSITARLPAATVAGYLGPAALPELIGRTLALPLASGEIVPVGALSTAGAGPLRLVTVPVNPQRLPALQPGQRVDVFVTGAQTGVTALVLPGVLFLSAQASAASSTVAVTLEVPPSQAAALVNAGEVGNLDLVAIVPAGRDQGQVPAGEVSPPPGVLANSGGAP